MKLLLKKNLYILILSPVIVNFLFKFIFEKYELNLLGIYDFFSSLLIFFFLFTIGYNFKLLNKNFSITLGIISFFISIYLFETLGLFIFDNINLSLSFYICSFIWFIYFLVSLEKKLFAFAGLGFNKKFFDQLQSENLNITAVKEFPDHHKYSVDDIFQLLDEANKNDAYLVTTEKDHMRIPREFKSSVGIIYGKIILNDDLNIADTIEKYF